MGAPPHPDPGAAQCGEVGAVEILLAEVHEAAALLDGEAPVVVHDELAAGGFAEVAGCADLGPRLRLTAAFNAKLHQLDSHRQQPAQPSRAVDDRIERIEAAHPRKALPSTGGEGAAMRAEERTLDLQS